MRTISKKKTKTKFFSHLITYLFSQDHMLSYLPSPMNAANYCTTAVGARHSMGASCIDLISSTFPITKRAKLLGTGLRSQLYPKRLAATGWLSASASGPFPSSMRHARKDVPREHSSTKKDAKSTDTYHTPVLSDEVLTAAAVARGQFFIDGTLGGGGHSELLLRAGARVLGVDRDPEAIAQATSRLAPFGSQFSTLNANYSEISAYLAHAEKADGLLLDLGVSSRQLDSAPRGFSFQREGPLDMRMGPNARMTAAKLVNTYSESALADLIYTLGEEPRSRRIAAAIVAQRHKTPFTTTTQLASCIQTAVPRTGKTHPATRTFQAIRMTINEELESLSSTLEAAASILKPGGLLLIITFHSLEDRLVKQFFRSHSTPTIDDPTWPEARPNPALTYTLPVRKAISATRAEILANPRSRSAKLRIAKLIGNPSTPATPTAE